MSNSKILKHLKTVHIHRKEVRKSCWQMGLIWQGLIHDLSKYSPTEMKIAKYYSGKRSPHEECRALNGYSSSWNHHYHRNKHHFQFWWDENEDGQIIPVKMPFEYLVESFCDMVGAGKAYAKGKGVEWKTSDPWNYYIQHCKGKRIMNSQSEYLLKKLLWNLKEFGNEKEFYEWFKHIKLNLKKLYESNAIDY